ncbi:MAG: hypothetical protein PUF65_03195 [Lachnospiraceae bacterium]|nr:hypothetical protein [Lachnospiraceae bacterium]
MKRFSLRKENRGASLLAVLVALVFVGAIAAIITSITMVNIRMREVEQAGKKNFYSAEEYMDVVKSAVNTVAAEALEETQEDVYARYKTLKATGGRENVERELKSAYVQNLEKKFGVENGTSTKSGSAIVYKKDANYKASADGRLITEICKSMGESVVAVPSWFQTTATDAKCDLDYEKGMLTLKKIKVTYKNAQDYETTLSADIVIKTPELNVNKADKVPDITKYSLIADEQINVDVTNPVNVRGNVYAGPEGILFDKSGVGTFAGDTIVTRGDICTDAGSTAIVGDGSSKIWAENIKTTGKGTGPVMTINGNAFVANDLLVAGKDSQVTLQGKYYGYNFQDKYTGNYTGTDADIKDNAAYNSAILINAQSGKVDMMGLNYLMLSGRAFIARGNNAKNNDIKLGESVSPRTSQLAILVPMEYVNDNNDNPKFKSSDEQKRYAQSIHMDQVESYLNPGKPLVKYYYVDGGAPQHRYYLNFKDDQSANNFYSEYFSKNQDVYNATAGSYLDNDALVVGSSMLYTLRGNLLYRDVASASLQEKQITINATDWQPTGGFYWDFADSLAKKYKSLQTNLDPSGNGVNSTDVRFASADKSENSMFDVLVDRDVLLSKIPGASGSGIQSKEIAREAASDGTSRRVIYFVKNDGVADPAFVVNESDMMEGLIIATGDVLVNGPHFKGTIISGGTIRFAGGASIQADSVMLTNLIQAHGADLSGVLKNYNVVVGNPTDLGTIDRYTTYDNWKKNEE